jgi:hypothetical protein
VSPPEERTPEDPSVRHRNEPDAALANLHYVFTGSGIDIPNVPLHLLGELQIHPHPVEGPLWTTDFELEEAALYLMEPLGSSTLLSPTKPDFWMFGLARGAFGLHAKVGPIMILQQHWYTNGYSEPAIRECRDGIRAWNTSLVTLKTLTQDGPTSPRFLILFSDFRGHQEIWELDTNDDAAPDRQHDRGIPGRNIYSGIGDSNDPVLTAIKDSDDRVLAAAAQHLGRLIKGQEDANLHRQ